jgi:hypothetical protein
MGPKVGPDTKTNWPTHRRSQLNFNCKLQLLYKNINSGFTIPDTNKPNMEMKWVAFMLRIWKLSLQIPAFRCTVLNEVVPPGRSQYSTTTVHSFIHSFIVPSRNPYT